MDEPDSERRTAQNALCRVVRVIKTDSAQSSSNKCKN